MKPYGCQFHNPPAQAAVTTTTPTKAARNGDQRQTVHRSPSAHCAHWPQPSQRSDPAHSAHRLQASQHDDPAHSPHRWQPSHRSMQSPHMPQPLHRDPLHHFFRHGWAQPRQRDLRHSWHRLQPSQRDPVHSRHTSQSSQRDPVHSRHMPQPSQKNDPMHSRHMLQPSQRNPVHSQHKLQPLQRDPVHSRHKPQPSQRNSLHNPQASQRDPMQPSSDIHATGEMWRQQCICTNLQITAPINAARSGDHRATFAMAARVSSRSRLLWNLPSTHHSLSPSGFTTAGKSKLL